MSNINTYESPGVLKFNNKDCTNSLEIAESFQKHFLSAPSLLKSNILKPDSPSSKLPDHAKLREFITNEKNSLIKFTIPPLTPEKVAKSLADLKPKATGLDGLSV
jgi:hypothetical protein